jgi:phosphoribosylglycinamide formyltransferase-1
VIVVLISGRGSNLQALLEAGLPVRAVISNQAGAKGLALAESRGVATRVIEHRSFGTREEFESALGAEIDRHGAPLIALAGFMRVLTPSFVERYAGRALNIHPSLLPAFPGLDTHRRALAAGVKLHGCTVHFVTPQLDHGPIVIQAAVRVRRDDTPETLAERVLRQEHLIYPRAIRWVLERRVVIEEGIVHVEGNDAQLVIAPD